LQLEHFNSADFGIIFGRVFFFGVAADGARSKKAAVRAQTLGFFKRVHAIRQTRDLIRLLCARSSHQSEFTQTNK
jgi:hypothetical protein